MISLRRTSFRRRSTTRSPTRSSRSRNSAALRIALVLCAVAAAGAPQAGNLLIGASDDTFVNSEHPDNNNGASPGMFTGQTGTGGVMRGLVRFSLPTTLGGRATVSGATLTLTTELLGNGLPGNAATVSVAPVNAPWLQGNGFGNAQGTYTVGQPCGAGISGATWSYSECTTLTGWGTMTGAVSASASVPASAGAAVDWSSAQLTGDIQGWADTPSTNHGWALSSSSEGTNGQAQRFVSIETGGSGVPKLAVSYGCNAGFQDTGAGCTTCTTTALQGCVAAVAGNLCIDLAPSPTYVCSCNSAYQLGSDQQGHSICIPQTLDIDGNHVYDALTDGVLLIRYLLGVTGDALVSGAIGPSATRTTASDVTTYLNGIATSLDVDADGNNDAATDGLMVLRYLFGVRGDALTAGATAPSATRTGGDIETYIQSRMP